MEKVKREGWVVEMVEVVEVPHLDGEGEERGLGG